MQGYAAVTWSPQASQKSGFMFVSSHYNLPVLRDLYALEDITEKKSLSGGDKLVPFGAVIVCLSPHEPRLEDLPQLLNSYEQAFLTFVEVDLFFID